MTIKRVVTARPEDEFGRQVAAILGKLVGNTPSDSTATTVADLRTDFNALLAVLRALNGK